MEYTRFDRDLKDLARRNRWLGATVAALTLCLALSLGVVWSLIGSERTVIVPPGLNKSFWVTSSKASSEYLEQMGSFVAWLILDVSPATIDWKKDALLSYVDPEVYGVMKTRQDLEAERIKRLSASTYFLPQQIVPSEDTQSVVVRGRLRTQINGQETNSDLKAYLVHFHYAGGRIHLQTFKEIPDDQKSTMQTTAADGSAARAN